MLQTERLTIRELNHADVAFIIELLNTPGWLKFIGDRNVRTTEQAVSYLDNGPLKSYKENGFGLWLVKLKESKTPIGLCGILKRDYLDHPDIGFAFLPQYSGKGYAYEAVNTIVNYAQTEYGLNKLYAFTLEENNNSIKLLEKVGLKFMKPFQLPGSNETLWLYSN